LDHFQATRLRRQGSIVLQREEMRRVLSKSDRGSGAAVRAVFQKAKSWIGGQIANDESVLLRSRTGVAAQATSTRRTNTRGPTIPAAHTGSGRNSGVRSPSCGGGPQAWLAFRCQPPLEEGQRKRRRVKPAPSVMQCRRNSCPAKGIGEELVPAIEHAGNRSDPLWVGKFFLQLCGQHRW
jgi:hypothetical protein